MPFVKRAFDSAAFWPLVCVPLLVFGVLALTNGTTPGVLAGAGLVVGWGLTVPFGRASARWKADPTIRHQLVVAGWGLLAVVVMLGGMSWGMALDTAAS
jgi:hypothetical protein